jgi:hypothetical protein
VNLGGPFPELGFPHALKTPLGWLGRVKVWEVYWLKFVGGKLFLARICYANVLWDDCICGKPSSDLDRFIVIEHKMMANQPVGWQSVSKYNIHRTYAV